MMNTPAQIVVSGKRKFDDEMAAFQLKRANDHHAMDMQARAQKLKWQAEREKECLGMLKDVINNGDEKVARCFRILVDNATPVAALNDRVSEASGGNLTGSTASAATDSDNGGNLTSSTDDGNLTISASDTGGKLTGTATATTTVDNVVQVGPVFDGKVRVNLTSSYNFM
jgi:hypothetical protein